MLHSVGQDVRYAVRLMRRRPAFSLTAILVLSLGIGVNAALFSVVNTLFFTPLPVRAPANLFYVYQRSPEGRTFAPAMGAEELELLRTQSGALADYAVHARASMTLSVGDETQRLTGEAVSGNYFAFLGVGTAIGRPLGLSDDDPAAPAAIVISHALWVRQFQSDAGVLGRQVRMGDRYGAIVGVAPRGFYGVTHRLAPSDYWIAGAQTSDEKWRGAPIGRMKPDTTFAQIDAAVRALSSPLGEIQLQRLQATASPGSGFSPQLIDRQRRTQFPIRRAFDVDMPFEPDLRLIPRPLVAGVVGVVALVLLIATANIAGLLLARGVTRAGEVAVRRALGAGRARLTRQLLTESVLLSAVGGALGLGLAVILIGLFRGSAPARYALEVSIDLRVLLFAAGTCVMTGLVAGLAPSRQAARVNVLQALGAGVVGGRAVRRRLRHAIVIPQVALSLVLLVVAAAQTRALLRTELADRGYRAAGVTVFRYGRTPPRMLDMDIIRAWTTRQRTLHADIATRLRGSPHVAAFGFTSFLPLSGDGNHPRSVITEADFTAGQPAFRGASAVAVTAGYFETMSIEVQRGREFDSHDSEMSGKVVVLSEAIARRLWPTRDAVGQRLALTGNPRPTDWVEVVGVVADVTPVIGAEQPSLFIYLPQEQYPVTGLTLVARGTGDQRGLVQDVTRAARDAEPLLEVWQAQTLSQLVGDILYPRRLAAAVLAAAGLIGLLLACIGLYGVVSYSVEQRLREIGIRATLGAERSDIVALVLREGVAVTLLGGVVGLGLATLALRFATRQIPSLAQGDAVSYLSVSGVLAACVLTACFVPAWRASRVDPAQVLRGN